jgi:hypothetical protein
LATGNCLTAFRLYATRRLTADSSQLTPEDAQAQALDQLILGARANEELYKAAKDRPDFPDILAKATTKDTSLAGQAVLFGPQGIVAKLIDDIYRDDAHMGKRKLIRVQQEAAASRKFSALFLLLYAYPLNSDSSPNADALDYLRAAYSANSTDLFNLVAGKNPPPAR